MNLTEIKSRRN